MHPQHKIKERKKSILGGIAPNKIDEMLGLR
jgi:hypothetical protein